MPGDTRGSCTQGARLVSQGRLLFPSGAAQMGKSGPGPRHHSILIDKPVRLRVFFSPVTDSEDDGESEAAKQLIQPIAEKIIAKYKAKEEEAPLLFFVAGEVSAAVAWPRGWLSWPAFRTPVITALGDV